MSIFLLMVPAPHKFGDEAFDILRGPAGRVEVCDGLASGERLGKRAALRNVGLQDGRVERHQRVANIVPNNSVSYFTINNNYLFNGFFKALCLGDKVHGFGGRPVNRSALDLNRADHHAATTTAIKSLNGQPIGPPSA